MIAVTGATGLLGTYIVQRLVAENKSCVAIKQASGVIPEELRHTNIEWRTANICDPDSLLSAFDGAEGVIHSAAIVSYHKRDKKRILSVNIEGTRNVVNACLHQGITRLLHVSSVAALGKHNNQNNIDENARWSETVINSTYATSKYMAELEVWRGQEEGLHTVIVNPSVILAPASSFKSSAQLFQYVWKQQPFYTDGSFGAVDVRDVAQCITKLYNSPIENERFIISSQSISYYEFFKKVANHFNKRIPYIRVHKQLLHVAAFVEAIRGFLTNSTPVITHETAQLAGYHFIYNNKKIKNTLNFDFQSIDSTIAWCCQQYMNNSIVKK